MSKASTAAQLAITYILGALFLQPLGAQAVDGPNESLLVRINRLEAVIPPPPTYYYEIESFSQGVANVWTDLTAPLTGTDADRQAHDDFYAAALNYRAAGQIALIQAKRFALVGDATASSEAIRQFKRNMAQLALANSGSAAAYLDGIEASRPLAEEIYRLSKIAATVMSRAAGPTATSVIDSVFMLTDANIERSEVGLSRAGKNLVAELAVKAIFRYGKVEELGGRSLADFIDDPATKYIGQSGLYELMGQIGDAPGVRAELMRMIAVNTSVSLQNLAEDEIVEIVDAVLSSEVWHADDSVLDPKSVALPPYYPGQVSMPDAISMLGPSVGGKRRTLLRKIEPRLGRNLIAVDIIALSGGRDDKYYVQNVRTLRKHLPDPVNTAYALVLLKGLVGDDRYSVIRELLKTLPKPVSLDDIRAMAGNGGDKYYQNLFLFRGWWPVLSSAKDVIELLAPMGTKERSSALGHFRMSIKGPIAPAELVELAGRRDDRTYARNVLFVIDLLQPSISIEEYRQILVDVAGSARSSIESKLVPRVDSLKNK